MLTIRDFMVDMQMVTIILAIIAYLLISPHATDIFCFLHDRIKKRMILKFRQIDIHSRFLASETEFLKVKEEKFRSAWLKLTGFIILFIGVLPVLASFTGPSESRAMFNFQLWELIVPDERRAWFLDSLIFLMFSSMSGGFVLSINPSECYKIYIEDKSGNVTDISFFDKSTALDVRSNLTKEV